MSPRAADQEAFVLAWLERHPGGTSAVDAAFHDAWHARFGGARTEKLWGAQPVRAAMARLHAMARAGRLVRARMGIGCVAGGGFPTWVWVYDLPVRGDT